jgi:hypothetical protein
VGATARLRRATDRAVSRHLHDAYHRAAEAGLIRSAWSRLAPDRLQPRLVRFGDGILATEKLLVGGREIARYDSYRRDWTIERPYRLLVDEAALPHFPRPVLPERLVQPTEDGDADTV